MSSEIPPSLFADSANFKGFLESIVHSISEGITVDNMEGYLTFVNPAAASLLGYTPDELIGKPWDFIVPPDQVETVRMATQRRMHGVSDRYELEMLHKEGRRVVVLVSGSPRIEQGQMVGTLAILSDISERKRMEAALQQQIQAEREQRMVSQALQEVSALLTSQVSLHDVLESILDLLGWVVSYDRASIHLLDESGGFHLAASRGPQAPGLPDSQGEVSGDASAHELFGAAAVPGAQANLARSTVILGATRSWLSAPLHVQGRLIGTLNVNNNTPNAYDERMGETVLAFANQAAVAIENARLFEAEHVARKRSEAMRDAARLLGSSLSQDAVLEYVLDQLALVLQFDSANVMLVEGDHAVTKIRRGYLEMADGDDGGALQMGRIEIDASQTIGEVIRTHRSMVIHDAQNDPRWVPLPFSAHIYSWLGVPLISRDDVIGLFSLDRSASRPPFSAQDMELAEDFSAHAAAAIANAHLFEAQEQRTAELLAVRQATLSLTASLELGEVLDNILQTALRLLNGARDAQVFLYFQDGMEDRLEFGAALRGLERIRKPISPPRANGLTYTVARTGQTLTVNDVRTHPMYREQPPGGGQWAGSSIGQPLKIGQRVVGVMVISYPKPRLFADSELRLLGLLGDQAAVAIQNASLYEQAARERRHLGLLYELVRMLTASLDYDQILQRALGLTCQVLGGLVGEAYLYYSETNSLSLRALYGRPAELVAELDASMHLMVGQGLAGWVAQTREAVNAPDVNLDPRWLPVDRLDAGVRSGIVAPVVSGAHLYGVLSVLHHQQAAFTNDHLNLLGAICQQVALALSNAERYQQVQNLVNMLAAEQSRLESMVERLPVGVILLDEAHNIRVINLIANQLVQRLTTSHLNDRLERLGPFELPELLAQSGAPLPSEIVLDGPRRAVIEILVRPVRQQPREWIITLRDVTQERDNLERIKMQDRLATVGQLAAGIAHDFNNIMAAIMVYSDLLIRDKSLPPHTHERLAVIQQQVQRASSLIRQILDFSRRSVMEQTDMDLLPFLKEQVKLLERVLPENIRLDLSFNPQTYLVKADPTRLQQVFMNLAVNARDAMPNGGLLRFHAYRQQFTAEEFLPLPGLSAGDWVAVAVQDSGTGIPPEVLPHIFDPFYTTKPIGQGTGLGLAQVFGIVNQHGGTIDVRSQVGQGTSFIVYLPMLQRAQAEVVQVEGDDDLDGNGRSVLVVEDDPVTRDALADLLRSYNFAVLIASNGAEAKRIFAAEAGQICMVVTDLVMPEVGGMALYQEIKATHPNVPVLFVTGHPLDLRSQELLERGWVHWLQKPFSAVQFSTAVRGLLGPK